MTSPVPIGSGLPITRYGAINDTRITLFDTFVIDTKTGNKHTPGKHAAPAGTPSTPDSGNAPKHATDGSGDKAEKDKSDSDTGGSSQTGGASGGESAGNAG